MTATAWRHVSSPGSGPASGLYGVTALSSANAWAVGYFDNGTSHQTLVLHWNGTAWKLVPSPNPGGPDHANLLYGVRASSASNIWAVGTTGGFTLALHCC